MSPTRNRVRIGGLVASYVIVLVTVARAQAPVPAPTDSAGVHAAVPSNVAHDSLATSPPPAPSPSPTPEIESIGLPTLREIPESSTELDLPNRLLSPDTSASLGIWYTSLTNALRRAGISSSRSFLLADGGLAVMTPFQRIDEKGNRCGSAQEACGECGGFLSRVFSRPTCHYRAFVFAMSRSVPQSATNAVTRRELEQLQQTGMNGVPPIGLERTTKGLSARVFICEYECDDAREDVTFVSSSLISALDHVTKAKLWKAREVKRAQ